MILAFSLKEAFLESLFFIDKNETLLNYVKKL